MNELTPISKTDPQGEWIAGLAEGSEELTAALEKASTVFEESLAAHRASIGSLTKTNEELRAALVAAESRNLQSTTLYEARIRVLEEKLGLQATTQKIEFDKMLTRCDEIIEPLKQTAALAMLQLYTSYYKNDPFPGLAQRVAGWREKVDQKFHSKIHPDQYLNVVLDSFIEPIVAEIELLRTQIAALSK